VIFVEKRAGLGFKTLGNCNSVGAEFGDQQRTL
jgi:hypothetical protein